MSNDFGLRCPCCKGVICDFNLTHNLNTMAKHAGLYNVLWHPDERSDPVRKNQFAYYPTAQSMIETLEAGLLILQTVPEYLKALNPDNGYGTYEQLVEATKKLIEQCKAHPEAEPFADI